MKLFFYFVCIISMITSIVAIIHSNPMHSLLYLIITIIGISIIFFILGAEFAGALEVIIYAGAIMILFVFVLMLLNLNIEKKYQIIKSLNSLLFIAPIILIVLLFFLLMYSLFDLNNYNLYVNNIVIDSKKIGIKLFGPYLIVVELVSVLLLNSLILAFHLGKKS